MLLNLLNVRVIVNDKDIYPLQNNKPVIIETEDDSTLITVTDGFHFTKDIKLDFRKPSFYKLKVVCAIDDLQLLTGFGFLSALYLLGMYTDLLPLKLLSFLPLIYFLFIYYINRKEFIRVRPA
jgi:hypothetical protein